MPSWTDLVSNNLKMAAVGTVAVLVTGTGAATTVSLVSDSTEAPETVVATSPTTPLADVTVPVEVEVDNDDVSDAAETPESDTHTVGIRPTDTHGYCVSTAVHAATAAPGQSLGAAKSAAAHSCAKKDKPAKPAKPTHAKAAKPKHVKHVKPAKAPKSRPATSKAHGKKK
ncbi:MAG: hypothetical protein LC789_12555 [Actinobacteria bacterium]|nr:hypothetical protein [Actinomycetota bacterium]